MPTLPRTRACRTCRVTTTNPSGYCDTHQADAEAAKRARRPDLHAEQTANARLVAAWRATRGDWCPGWRRPGHHADPPGGPNPLTVDHVIPGQPAKQILCRLCNSAKGART